MSADQGEVTTISDLSPARGRRGAIPFNGLPLLPPQEEVETKRTLKKAITANKALAELKTAGDLIPNQAILIRAIVLQEAKLSSEIENIVTTNDELYRAFSDDAEKTDPSTKEVLKYEEGLWHGYQHLRASGLLTSRLFIEIVQIIKQQDINVRSLPGTRVVNRSTGEPIYSPPEGQLLIRGLLDNLSSFLYNEDDIDPLIKMAIAHYQFEAIHPFPDGNGRTGRIINILYLVEQKLLGIPVLYLSKYIIQNKALYYEGLRRVTEEAAWEDWIVYMLEGIEQTARDTKNKIDAIRKAMLESAEFAKSEMKKGYSKELIELIFQQPYTRISSLEEVGIAKRDAASLYLRELDRIGILKGFKQGREMLYINTSLFDILSS
jgi:Fic family protein